MTLGATIFLSYEILIHFFKSDPRLRMKFYDHAKTVWLMGTVGGFFFLSKPAHIITASFMSLAFIAPTSWYLSHILKDEFLPSPNIFYENNVTKQEIERF